MPGADPDPGASRAAVVVTGAGAVSSFGWGLDNLWDGLRSGRTSVGRFDRFNHSGHRTHLAGEVRLAEEPARRARKPRRRSIADRFSVAAARAASITGQTLVVDAGLTA